MKSQIELCILGITFFTRIFLVEIGESHLSDRSITEYSEMNVKSVATLQYQCKKERGKYVAGAT